MSGHLFGDTAVLSGRSLRHIARTSAMWAHVVTSLVANLISLVVVVLVVLLMDFRSAAGWGRGSPSSPVSRPSPRTVRARSPTR